MAQTQSLTAEGYAEAAKLLTGAAASAWRSIALINADFTANEAVTHAAISGNYSAVSGLAQADATTRETTTTTNANDTIHLAHTFTAGGSATIYGAAAENDDNDIVYATVKFNAAIPLESTNTLAISFTNQLKSD
jgi:hypothetical protein